MYHLQLREFVDNYCIADYMQEPLYRRSLARKIIDVCGCIVFMNIDNGIQISKKSFILINTALIWGILLAAFVLDAMPVNAAYWSVLTNNVVDEHPRL